MRLFLLPLVTFIMAVTYIGFDQQVPGELPKEISPSAYPEHLTGAFTGGFGEQTCRNCHFDYDLNPEGGDLSVSGIPKNIQAGEAVAITITVKRKELGRAGFQLTARYEDGSQAGHFDIGDNKRLTFTGVGSDSLQYVQHSKPGSKIGEDGEGSWTVRWIAPREVGGTIIFNVVANAANGDQSEFGDFIYAKEIRVKQ